MYLYVNLSSWLVCEGFGRWYEALQKVEEERQLQLHEGGGSIDWRSQPPCRLLDDFRARSDADLQPSHRCGTTVG